MITDVRSYSEDGDLNVSDDTFVAVQPDEDDPARPILSRQRSWNALTCNFPTGTY
ncbi:hypothetical protein ACIQIE_35790 [Streptomyces globisporus]|uniref:hypothetical protein n=1 Tax=Streptomyces globisporus TaxID=1908 RepID=UPI0038023132